MFHKKRRFIAVTIGLLFCALVLVACGTKSSDEGTASKQEEATTTPASATAIKAADPIVPSGWKTVSDGQWSLSIPEDWVDDSGSYYPEDAVSSSTGIPYISCVIGYRGIPDGETAEDQLKMVIGFGPMTKTPMKVCGKDGYMVEGKEGLVLFYEQEASVSLGAKFVMDGIWCTAPSSSGFSQYEAIFRHILESVHCSTD